MLHLYSTRINSDEGKKRDTVFEFQQRKMKIVLNDNFNRFSIFLINAQLAKKVHCKCNADSQNRQKQSNFIVKALQLLKKKKKVDEKNLFLGMHAREIGFTIYRILVDDPNFKIIKKTTIFQ